MRNNSEVTFSSITILQDWTLALIQPSLVCSQVSRNYSNSSGHGEAHLTWKRPSSPILFAHASSCISFHCNKRWISLTLDMSISIPLLLLCALLRFLRVLPFLLTILFGSQQLWLINKRSSLSTNWNCNLTGTCTYCWFCLLSLTANQETPFLLFLGLTQSVLSELPTSGCSSSCQPELDYGLLIIYSRLCGP